MRPRIVFLVVVAFVLAVLSVTRRTMAAPRAIPRPQREAIAREIEAQLRATNDLSKPNVVARLLSLYPDTGRIVSATAGGMITSRDTLADGLRYFWNNVGRNMREPRWEWDRFVIDVLAPDAAVMTATYHVPHRTPQGQPHVIGGAWTAVLVKRSGRWLIIQEHLSDLPAEPAAPGGPMPADTARADSAAHRGH